MADELARRRELRRRKILQNPEGRLRKLLGENSTLSSEVDNNSNISSAPPSSRGTHTPEAPALSTRYLIRDTSDINEESDFRDGNVSTARTDETPLLAGRLQLNNCPIETHHRTSRDEIFTRDSAKSVTTVNNYWFAKPKMRKIMFALLAFVVYFALVVDIFYLLGQSIFIPFVCVEIFIISYELLYVPQTSIIAINVAHGLLNGALILSGVPESIIIKSSTFISYSARIWHDFAIFFFTFLCLHTFVMETVNIWT